MLQNYLRNRFGSTGSDKIRKQIPGQILYIGTYEQIIEFVATYLPFQYNIQQKFAIKTFLNLSSLNTYRCLS